MNVIELKQKRTAAISRAKALRDTAKAEGRDLTADEYQTFSEAIDEAESIRVQIDQADGSVDKALASTEAWDKQAQPPKARVSPTAGVRPDNATGHYTTRSVGTTTWVGGAGGSGRRYADLFGPPRGTDGFASFGQFLAMVDSGRHHDALRPAASMVGSDGASGGYLVPEMYASMLLDKSLEREIVRPRATIHRMDSSTLKIAGFDNLDHSSHLYGGLTGYWIGEADTITSHDAKTRKIELKARKLAILSRSSNELAADARDFETMLGEAMIGGCGWYMDWAFLRGTGAGQPLGVINDPALITVDAEASQAASTILYDNLVKMLARLHPACYGNAVWVANPTTIPQLLTLTIRVQDAAGTDYVGGSHVRVLNETGDGSYTMLGRPALFTEKLPALGTKGDILLADFSQYSIGLRKEISVEKSGHVYFASDEAAFRSIVRVDGQGRWSSALTPDAGDTLSWCIALATRAG